MEMTKIAGITMIAAGGVLLVWSFLAYAKHRLTESFGMAWGIAALCLGAAGIVLLVAEQGSTALAAVALCLGVLLVLCLFGFSQAISVLIMKNQELAMQVSLLNQENEGILQELAAVKEQKTHE